MKYLLFPILCLSLTSCKTINNQKQDLPAENPQVSRIEIQQIPIDSLIIRALQYRDGRYWFSGSGNQYGYLKEESAAPVIRKIEAFEKDFEFRSIAVLEDKTLILNAGAPAMIYAINHKSLKSELIYLEETDGVFYDSMLFVDDQKGYIIGDPTEFEGNKCIAILKTTNGGESWSRVSCDRVPEFIQGEAAFAASNSNISVTGNNVWIATGGKASRIFTSTDSGNSFTAIATPMMAGGTMTGTFAMDYYDEKTGVIIGGNWEDKSNNTKNLAITTNGGETWNLVSDGRGVGYASDIQFIKDGGGEELLATGSEGIWYSPDLGKSWKKLSHQGFYTAAMESGRKGVLAGRNAMARFKLIRK